MKRFVAILGILLSVAGTCFGQKEKVVERSSDRTPEWLGISDADHICASSAAATLDAARNGCMDEIKQHIATSIAANITSEEAFSQDALVRNNLTTMLTRYSSQVDTKSAEMPYLCGISLTKATDIYWERRYVKQQKRYYYICHIRYPFTKEERQAAIDDFMRIDRRHEDCLEELQRNFHTFTDLSYIGDAVSELDILIGYFFDNNRRNSAVALQEKYRRARSEVGIVPDDSDTGCFRYHLSLHGRHVTTVSLPSLKSDYAVNMRVISDRDGYILLYDELGIEGEDNTVTINYPFGRDSRYTLVFDPTKNKVSVRPCGTVTVKATDNSHWRIGIPLRSHTDSGFEVERIEMEIAGTTISAVPSPSERIFRGKGEHLLAFVVEIAEKPGEGTLTHGFIRIRNPHVGTSTDVAFTLPYKINL